jgi:hypothetical protein
MWARTALIAIAVTVPFAVLSVGCTKPPRSTKAETAQPAQTMDNIAYEVQRDLQLTGTETTIVEITTSDLNRPEMRTRDEALVLTREPNGYTLRYVCRFPDSSNANLRKWRLWMNHDIIDDGTGAEVPAIETFAIRPGSEQIESFKSATLGHWSNR